MRVVTTSLRVWSLIQCSLAVHDGGEGVECVYEVKKVKDLPKLHRAVWKKDINKVKAITNGSKASVLNAYDKEKR